MGRHMEGISHGTRGLASGMKGADPSLVDGASAVLARLGRLAVDGQHGVGRAGVPDVPLDDLLPHLVIAPVCPKLFDWSWRLNTSAGASKRRALRLAFGCKPTTKKPSPPK